MEKRWPGVKDSLRGQWEVQNWGNRQVLVEKTLKWQTKKRANTEITASQENDSG